jgi:hypothetical protein
VNSALSGEEFAWLFGNPPVPHGTMGKIREYRIPMPLTVEEYQLAQLYMTAKKSRMETQDQEGAGVEVLKCAPPAPSFANALCHRL